MGPYAVFIVRQHKCDSSILQHDPEMKKKRKQTKKKPNKRNDRVIQSEFSGIEARRTQEFEVTLIV